MNKKFYKDLGFSKVDLERAKLKGFPEVIFCQGKTPDQVLKIAQALQAKKQKVLATRASEKIYKILKNRFVNARYFEQARIITISNERVKQKNIIKTKSAKKQTKGKILVITGGTADIPIAEEAAVTAEFMGSKIERLYDVGVAGLHRLLSNTNKIRNANVIIVVAGMEGALASVVSGLTSKPVIAVPTSIGYGASFKGIASLLTMLNSCSPGMVVVNIDNGFGAGYFASIINK